ncbi:histidinol-phosphate transaminase [Helicobacter burdigaliensis]|uniref:histidinol-phosphate transaminase n=1 Tax=Helicobacter burdigaliensis TaxID=2315334 RepID=UPI000EF6C651|nr:histidinol-phosphate transaminase [Helicobacter burdigaliensis]
MKFNPILDTLQTYEAGKPIELVVRDFGLSADSIIKLASNENPLGASKKVIQALKDNAHLVHLYPDDSYYALKEALCYHYSILAQEIIIGAGSDQIIEFCIHAKAPSKVLMAKTTFAMYEIYSKSIGAKILKTKSDSHNLSEFLELYKLHNPEVIFLCIPNNPLGECLDKKEVFSFLKQISKNTLVIVDGAYQEYAAFKDGNKEIKPKELIEQFPNCIYLGTFSKAYGLGGMRVGYGIAKEEIISHLLKIRPPFNITTLSLCAATIALKDKEHIQKTLQNNFSQMQSYEEFAKQNKIDFIPSFTNFITFLLERIDSNALADFLLKRGIIIRNLKSYGLNAVRITIGTKEQNQKLFKAFEEFLKASV